MSGRGGIAVVANDQAHLLALVYDIDGDPGRVAGVAHRVGDRLLGDPVEGDFHGRAEFIEVAGQLHVDPRPPADLAR
ncbi:MAG: hypothetical protein H0V49_11700, partial [Nocardioidaceae bacterium]|nr:hypothetical protein [Nocardioidaceae bacterium]